MARLLQRGHRPVTHEPDVTPPTLTEVPTHAIRWVRGEAGEIPSGAVPGGTTLDGETVYIGRTRLPENHNELTPGFVVPSSQCVMVSYGTGVRRSSDYEVLTTSDQATIHWLPCNHGNVPPNSVIGGIDCSYLEPLFVGRTCVDLRHGRTWRGRRLAMSTRRENADDIISSIQFPGKVHRSHKCLYIPYYDKEYLFRDYEVLALKESPASLLDICRSKVQMCIFGGCDLENEEFEERAKVLDTLPLPDKLREYCKHSMM